MHLWHTGKSFAWHYFWKFCVKRVTKILFSTYNRTSLGLPAIMEKCPTTHYIINQKTQWMEDIHTILDVIISFLNFNFSDGITGGHIRPSNAKKRDLFGTIIANFTAALASTSSWCNAVRLGICKFRTGTVCVCHLVKWQLLSF